MKESSPTCLPPGPGGPEGGSCSSMSFHMTAEHGDSHFSDGLIFPEKALPRAREEAAMLLLA